MKTFFRNLALPLCLGLAATFLLSACGRYQMGSPGTLQIQSIYVQPVINESFAPQAQALLSGQIRDAFIRDGRVRLASSPENADGVLEVTLTNFRRSTSSFNAEDTTTALTTDLDLEARVTLYRGDTVDTFFSNRMVRNSSAVYTRNPFAAEGDAATARQDSIASEYNEMPQLTRDLARRIADEVLNAW